MNCFISKMHTDLFSKCKQKEQLFFFRTVVNSCYLKYITKCILKCVYIHLYWKIFLTEHTSHLQSNTVSLDDWTGNLLGTSQTDRAVRRVLKCLVKYSFYVIKLIVIASAQYFRAIQLNLMRLYFTKNVCPKQESSGAWSTRGKVRNKELTINLILIENIYTLLLFFFPCGYSLNSQNQCNHPIWKLNSWRVLLIIFNELVVFVFFWYREPSLTVWKMWLYFVLIFFHYIWLQQLVLRAIRAG